MKAERTNLSRRVEAALSLTLPKGISHDLLNEIDRLTRDRDVLLAACKAAMELFNKNNAIDQFDWASSVLSASSIRELNELPPILRSAIAKAEAE